MKADVNELEKIVEEVGVHFEQTKHLPPLAARIYAMLILSPRSGCSFDELVELSKSSKSSVSTNVNLLLNIGVLEYYTKTGERKRYFRLSKNYLAVALKKAKEQVAEELTILDKVSGFIGKYCQEKKEKHRKFECLFRDYLQAEHDNLESTILKMNQLDKLD